MWRSTQAWVRCCTEAGIKFSCTPKWLTCKESLKTGEATKWRTRSLNACLLYTRVVRKYQLSAGGLCGKRRSTFDAQRMHTPPTMGTSREALGPVKKLRRLTITSMVILDVAHPKSGIAGSNVGPEENSSANT